MYKFYHKILPDIFSNLYICNSDVHSYNTRQHLCYHVPMSRLTQTSRNIRYTGVKTHAFMSSIISYCCSFATYKKSITNVLLSNGNINSLWIMIYLLHAVIPLCYPSNQMIGILSVRCGAVLARSIFYKILALDTPYLTHVGQLLGVYSEIELKLWSMFFYSHCSTVYNIVSYWTALWRHPTICILMCNSRE